MKLQSLTKTGAALIVVVFFVCCARAVPPVIKDFGPKETRAGMGFNIQPDGASAVWVNADNITDATAIMWDDRKLPTFRGIGVITAPVPKELYAKPGQYRIYLLEAKTGARSNSVVFTVK